MAKELSNAEKLAAYDRIKASQKARNEKSRQKQLEQGFKTLSVRVKETDLKAVLSHYNFTNFQSLVNSVISNSLREISALKATQQQQTKLPQPPQTATSIATKISAETVSKFG